MEIYLIKWAACLTIFFLFYKVFLENMSLHLFKRFYLLGSLVGAFVIPLITFTQYVVVHEPILPVIASQMSPQVSYTAVEPMVETSYLNTVLWSIYGLGVLFFSLRFGRNLYRIVQKIRRNPILRKHNLFHVLLGAPTTPHTFFSYIFLNKQKFEANEIPREVMLHERTHAVQKHSADVLLIELIQIVFWFNPLIYWIKHSIKLNHEFLADRAVLKEGISTVGYQKILLAFSSTAGTPILANSINYSSNRLNHLFSKIAFGQVKKRFTVMKKQTSTRAIWLRTLILLPLLALLIYGFSSTQIIETKAKVNSEETIKATSAELATYNKLAQHYNEQFAKDNSKRIVKLSDLKVMERIYKRMNVEQKNASQPFPECIPPPPPVTQDKNSFTPEKATPQQIKEYNKLAKKYNEMDPQNMWIDEKDVTRMRYLYDLMTLKQRKKAEPYPSFPPPPPAPDAPKVAVLADIPPPPPPPSPDEPNKFKLADVPPPPPAPDAKNEFILADPPPPPPPPQVDPREHIRKMIDQGATFYYEGKEITPNYVQDLVLFNKNLNIQTKTYNSSPPIVHISRDFVFEREVNSSTNNNANQWVSGPKKKPETPSEVVDRMIPLGALFFLNGKNISKEEAKKAAKNIKGIMVEVLEKEGEKPKVLLMDGC